MRFIVDECTGPGVAGWLRSQQYEVFSVYDEAQGMSDDDIIKKAREENWIIITNDKDFGEKIFREFFEHKGIVLLRVENERSANKIHVLNRLLLSYIDRLPGSCVVATETQARFAKK